jgi:A/G-specific adenine glycosylase
MLAFAFDRPVAPLDTNVARVLDRALGPLPAAPRARQAAADGYVPATASASWSHALMDIGATICVARGPHCEACPVRMWCRARVSGDPRTAPVDRGLPRQKTPRFTTTTRWLRGRILDRLRDAPEGEWVLFGEALGNHAAATVNAELTRLQGDGLLELDSARRARLVSSP